MTCIVGVAHAGGVVVGGDSLGSNGSTSVLRRDPKVVTRGQFVFGFTTSFRMGQVLAHRFEPPPQGEVPDYEYLVTSFVDSLRQTFKDAGYAKKENEVESAGDFVLAYHGHLYQVYSDYQVEMPQNGYVSCGSGYQVALGSLHSTSRLTNVEKRVVMALEAAEHHTPYVRRPWVIVRQEKPT